MVVGKIEAFSDSVISNELRSRLVALLNDLPAKTRDLLLKYFEVNK